MRQSDFDRLQARVTANNPITLPKPKKKKYRSKTEELYANQLQARKLAGEIEEWFYEPITFKLADGLKYTIDFMVVIKAFYANAEIEYVEIKGGNPTRSGINKFKSVRSLFPFFKFRMIQYSGGNWTEKYPE